jgi:hypothetical protein
LAFEHDCIRACVSSPSNSLADKRYQSSTPKVMHTRDNPVEETNDHCAGRQIQLDGKSERPMRSASELMSPHLTGVAVLT